MTAKRCPRCNEVVGINVDYGKEYSSLFQLLELVDGALEIVALWKAESPAQKRWQAAWIKKAKEMGASFDDDFEIKSPPKGLMLALKELNKDDQINYVVHYKWQEGAELFFNREIIKDFAIKDEDALGKLENRLLTILSNCGMEEEQLATVQITGITQL